MSFEVCSHQFPDFRYDFLYAVANVGYGEACLFHGTYLNKWSRLDYRHIHILQMTNRCNTKSNSFIQIRQFERSIGIDYDLENWMIV